MIFHQFGKNGVMRELEPLKDANPHELCIILEIAAATQEIATAICSMARTEMLHCPSEEEWRQRWKYCSSVYTIRNTTRGSL